MTFQFTTSVQHYFSGVTTQKASILYDSSGNVISNLDTVETDSSIYLSFGEAFTKPKIRTFLQLVFHGVTAHKFPDSDRLLVEKRLLEEEETADPPKKFCYSFGVPLSYKASEALLKQKLKTLSLVVNEMSARQIFDDNLFLQHNKNTQRIIYPSLQSNRKDSSQKPGKQTIVSASQTWLYTKNHEIKPKSFPKLCLVVSNHAVMLKKDSETVEGYMVTLSAEMRTKWEATKDGHLICSRTGLLLTSLENPAELFVPSIAEPASAAPIRRSTRESGTTNDGTFDVYGQTSDELVVTFPEIAKGEEPFIVAFPVLESSKESQRWAFKQENIALLGQWKLCNINNPEWSKECLSWPTDSDGSQNTELSWPIEGLLMSKAPSLKEVKSPTKGPSTSAPVLRLYVRYNGSCDPARHVTAPDLSNMKKDLAIKRRSFDKKMSRQPDTQRWLEKHSKGQSDVEDQDGVVELEFRLFLDKCGSVLGLNTPPTRLFTDTGEELITLESLERDAEVFVSCGAEFDPPDGERNIRNKLLYDVSSDVDKLKTFCSAIAPTTYVVSVSEIKRHATVRLQILTDSEVCQLNESDSMSDILQIADLNKSIEDKPDSQHDDSNDSLDPYHLKSHVCQNETDLEMIEQYPWRNPAFISGLVKDKLDWQRAHSSGESEAESDVESVKSIKSNSSTSSSKARRKGRVFNQWIYKDCRFFLMENPQYVLCAGVDNEVELVVYDKNSAQQCWTVDEEFIYSSNGQSLTVTQCSVNPPNPVDHAGSKLKIAPFQAVINGNSNQKWEFDQSTGHLKAFAGTPICTSISAALQAKICTFAVTSSDNAEQPAFIMENPGILGIPDDNTHIYVCGSCATALRDRYIVDKIDTTTYVCSVGYYSSTANLAMKSSLVALGGLEGLQPGKAFGTLYLWESLLGDLRQQTSLKSIKDVVKQTLQLECPNEGLVLVRCYVNGTGPPKHHGALFLARSFEEILRKCLIELKPGRPLSRVFLAGGTEIFNFQSLLEKKVGSAEEVSPVPYKELFVSTGEGFIRPHKPKGVPSLKRRLKMYRELNKLDVASLQSACSSKGMSRPPHLPAGNNKHAQPVYITRNGDFVGAAVRVVAHNLNGLLETATLRLKLPLAARRVFSSSGVEVLSWGEIVRDQALVISTGEAFVRKDRKSKWIHRKLENEK